MGIKKPESALVELRLASALTCLVASTLGVIATYDADYNVFRSLWPDGSFQEITGLVPFMQKLAELQG